jgi:hypothetical protein
MNAEMILAGVMLAGTVLSSILLLRARRLSVEMWSAKPSSQFLPMGSDVTCLVEMNQAFRTQERQV